MILNDVITQSKPTCTNFGLSLNIMMQALITSQTAG
jgi:hypothetical protein